MERITEDHLRMSFFVHFLSQLNIETTPHGYTMPNYRPKGRQYKPSSFLPKPVTKFELTTNFTIESSFKAVKRYFDPKETEINADIAEKAFDFLVRHFYPIMRDSTVLSNEEAASRIDHSTSSGYPFKFQGVTTKEKFYALPDVLEIITGDWDNMMFNPNYCDSITYDNIDKEEILPIEKIWAGDHRSIMVPPAHHLHNGVRLFSEQNHKMTGANTTTWISIGLPNTAGEWHRMVLGLLQHPNGFAGDERKWDATLPEFLMRVCQRFRQLCTPEEATRIERYYDVLIHTIVRMPNGVLLRKRRGNPSGSVNTSYDNTLCLFFILAYCWIEHCNESYESMMSNVRAKLYGDDNTFSVSDDFIKVFNLKTLGQTMSKFGIELKNPDDPPKPVADLDFLSHKWKYRNGFWLPYMDSEKLKCGMYYSQYPDDPYMQCHIVIDYLQTNPFPDDNFYKYCLDQLDILFKHMSTVDIVDIRNRIPTRKDLFKLYTGIESGGAMCAKVNAEHLIRGGGLNNMSPFKRKEVRVNQSKLKPHGAVNMSNEPTQVLHTVQHSNSEIRVGKKIFDSPLLDDHARRWLVRTLDPFHDTEVEPAGYPDFNTCPTVIQEINQSTEIDKGAITGNFDVHIFNMPHFASPVSLSMNSQTYNPIAGTFNNGVSTSVNFPDCGVVIVTAPAGTPTMPSGGTLTCSAVNLNPIQMLSSKCRVVGLGIEVVNTTAELYLQGQVTCYRMPQSSTLTNFVNSTYTGGAYYWGKDTGRMFNKPPSLHQEAITLPGSKFWPAKHGAYVVATQCGLENPIQGVDNMSSFMVANPFVKDTLALTGLGNFRSFNVATDINPGRYYAPFNTSGMYFTGLSNSSTLRVNVKWLIETCPGPNETLVTLAKAPSTYNFEALRLYSEIIEKLPVGVPFTENPSGEWFSEVLGIAGELAESASAINPLFMLLGKGLKTGRTIYDQISQAVDTKVKHMPKEKQVVMIPRPMPNPELLKQSRAMMQQLRSAPVKAKKLGNVPDKPKQRVAGKK
jgi:hypothetical protein